MTRRLIAVAVAILVLVLVLLGVRGCLNARAERGFENYVSDLGGIATQSNQLSKEFFDRLQSPDSGQGEIQLEAEIAADRGTAEGLLERVEELDVPDELADDQGELVQAFELRRDALAAVAADIPTALGNEGRNEATDRITGSMRALLASDVLYERARLGIESTLADQGIAGQVPQSPFLPEPVDRWLDNLSLGSILSSFATSSGTVKGVHGLALLSTTVDDTQLTADAENTVSTGNDPPEITIEVQNQGDSAEREVTVSYSLSGSVTPIEAEQTINSIDSQGIAEATIGLEAQPEPGTPLTLQVEVLPVPGETVTDNNTATYTVTFEE